MSTDPERSSDSQSSAIFLSYARNDLAGAQRLRDALVAAGLAVFFDLRQLDSGDDFDALIRNHIRTCSLFIPIISATTQSRPEAYFRLEWHLAEERARLMAKGVAFILPVAIDDTPESSALVPDKFLQVQWTRLPGGVPTPEFIQRVARLTQNRVTTYASGSPVGPLSTPPVPTRGKMRWIIAAAVVLTLGASGLLVHQYSTARLATAARPLAEKSVAVLPFTNLSTDAENAFFADGIHEDVITSLAKIHDLQVISRASVLVYRDPAQRDLRKIARALGVATLLEGSVRRAGNQVKVTMQLVDPVTRRHLWAETYNKEVNDVFAVQTVLAEEITRALQIRLTVGERSLISRQPTRNAKAYEFYTRARTMQQDVGFGGTREQGEAVIALYEKAIAEDPDFSLAHVQASIAHGYMYFFGGYDPSPARLERVRLAVEAAQRLAPDQPETHMAQGLYRFHTLDTAGALEELHLAEVGMPNDAQLLFALGGTLREMGRLQEALRYFRTSTDLNPNDLATVQLEIQTLLMLRRYDAAWELAERYTARVPRLRVLAELALKARYCRDGVSLGLLRALATLPARSGETEVLVDAYWSALRRDDFTGAGKILANPKLTVIPDEGELILDPVALHRAMLAFLTGNEAAARASAEEALRFYRKSQWTPRQAPWVEMHMAWAEALAGRAEVALERANKTFASLGSGDNFDALWMRPQLAQVHLILGRHDDALTILKEIDDEAMLAEPE